MNTVNADLAAATSLLSGVSVAFPLALTAYNVLKLIWLRTNPGKTEADFVNYLGTASQANVNDTAAQLRLDGWIETAPGVWSPPPGS